MPLAVPLPDIPAVETEILGRTNAYRAANKLAPVTTSKALTAAARAYAAYLARTETFSHTADGREPGERATAAGYKWCQVRENLAMHLDSRGFASKALADKAVQGWIESPGHRANLVAPHVTEIGIAVVRDPDERHPKYYAVQMFGRPQTMQYKIRIANKSGISVAYSVQGTKHRVDPLYTVTHSACAPETVTFAPAGPRTKPERFDAARDIEFTLERNPAGGYSVSARAAAAGSR